MIKQRPVLITSRKTLISFSVAVNKAAFFCVTKLRKTALEKCYHFCIQGENFLVQINVKDISVHMKWYEAHHNKILRTNIYFYIKKKPKLKNKIGSVIKTRLQVTREV